MTKFKNKFIRDTLEIKPLQDRRHRLNTGAISDLDSANTSKIDKNLSKIAASIISAKEKDSSIILMIGAHVIRSGVQRYIIDLMERGFVTSIATNGAGMIHDFEFAMIGATTESVADYIKEGQFGLWKETAQLNDIVNRAYAENAETGMGEAVGRFIEESDLAHKSISILARAHRLGMPFTIHVGIGYDIIHEHPNCNGAATGALSYNDFLKFASVVGNLENGVVMNFGSSVMAPEVFLKALSMARNAARQQSKEIKHFSVLVCDLMKLPKQTRKEPLPSDPAYFYRPWKTMLIRTVADGGQGFYVRGRHDETIPGLWSAINEAEASFGKGNRA